jgi:DNA-binding response OmpR family regulator
MALDVNILVVDDDRDICDYMKMLLGASGYNVTTLSDPTQATDVVKQGAFHVLIIDLMMPRMDGIQVIQSIRKIDNDVAIIVFTGYPSLDTAVEALKLSVSDYIKKPFEPEELRQKVAEILRKKGVQLNPEEELHRTIGAQIRQFRKERDLTLKQLARNTGLSVSLLSQIERAESSASVGSLYKISAALGVKLTQLFGDF